MKLAAVVLLLLSFAGGNAAEFKRLDVREEDGTYFVHATASINAGRDAVRAVLTDYDHMHWITGAVLEARTLDRVEPGIAIVLVRSRACFGIFCKTIEQVQRADARAPDRIVFETLPDRSDVKRGLTEWRLRADGVRATRVTWDLLMEPDFWVPPLIGPGLIRSGLTEEGRDMINGIEKLAKERESRQ